MDYEKLHNDTIAKLQEMVNSGKITVEIARGICVDFVPEDEDERVRKAMIDFFKHEREEGIAVFHYGVNIERIIAWLEKQGKQKPVECCADKLWTEFQKQVAYLMASSYNREYEYTKGYVEWVAQSLLGYAKNEIEQKPAEWSEEDEKNLLDIDYLIHSFRTGNDEYELSCWLKSLRPQKQWKPSEEQIKVCKEVYADILSAKGFDLGTVNSELNRLEEQLKTRSYGSKHTIR